MLRSRSGLAGQGIRKASGWNGQSSGMAQKGETRASELSAQAAAHTLMPFYKSRKSQEGQEIDVSDVNFAEKIM